MLLHRQKYLLSLVSAFGGRMANLDFQKLLFLHAAALPAGTAPYEFVPYKRGAFSFTSYADRRSLIARGLLVADEKVWRLTAEGAAAAGEPPASLMAFATAHRKRGDALVVETYKRFPYSATRSEIAARLLRNDQAALAAIEAAQPRPGHELLTIGYEGRTLEAYLNELLRAGATTLCDVRRNPLSRKYGFSKKTLANACDGVGIAYVHVPELGIASERRRQLDTQADYDALFEEYERDDLPKEGEAVSQIAKRIRAGERVALTCYEALPEQCHRHCVAEAVERLLGGVKARQL